MIPTAMGWVVFELPEKKTITRVAIYTVDSEQYPAGKYGVKDLTVQFWAPEGWANVDGYDKRRGEKHHTVQNNKQGRIAVDFGPVQTSRVRVVVRYTNDAEVYGRGPKAGRKGKGYYRQVRGTIRLTEIEIYGPENQSAIASVSSNQADADKQILDEIFAMEPSDSLPERIPSETSNHAADPQAQIEGMIRAYASAYKRRDPSALMATVSPNYSRGGENYQQLKDKMERLFQRYTQIDFSLGRLRIQPLTGEATVAVDYVIALTPPSGSPATLSGKLLFTLVESENGWRIVRIETQKQ